MMAEDRKFKFEDGRFINRMSGEAIPDDEPVVIFRARDVHAISVLQHYYSLVRDEHHEQAIWELLNEFIGFRHANPERMKEPGITHHIELNSDREARHVQIGRTEDEMNHEREAKFHSWGSNHKHPHTTIEDRVATLEREMKETMSDVETLNSVLSGIANDATELSANFKNLEAELQTAQTAAANNQPIDLTSSILMARNAQAALDAIVQSAGTSGVAPAAATSGDASGGSTTTTAPAGDTIQPPAGDTTTATPTGGDTTQPPVGDTTQPPIDGTTQPPAAV